MCHGGLDPKYQVREIEARMRAVSFDAAPKPQAAKPPAASPQASPTDRALLAMLRGWRAVLRRKATRHV